MSDYSGENDDGGLRVSALYVFRQLEIHQKECARRWWAVMVAVIANLVVVLAGMLGALLSRGAHL